MRAPSSPEEYAAGKAAVEAFRNGKNGKLPDLHDPDLQVMMKDKYDEFWDTPKFSDLRLTAATAKRMLMANSVAKRNYIYPFLKLIHDQTGMPIIADGLLHSSRTLVSSTLLNTAKTTVRDACADLCLNFRRKIVEQDGWLVVSSRRYTLYRLCEPPHERVNEWTVRKKKGGLWFEDYAEMAAELSREQLDTLVNNPLNEEELRVESAYLLPWIPAFRLWNSLDKEQRTKLTGDGVALSELTAEAKRDFWRLCIRAEWPGTGLASKEPGLRMNCSTQETAMNLTTQKSVPDIRTARLPGMRGH